MAPKMKPMHEMGNQGPPQRSGHPGPKPMHEISDPGMSAKPSGQSVKPVAQAHDALKNEEQRTLGEPSDYYPYGKEVLTGEDAGDPN
jgi:hypothetical protein